MIFTKDLTAARAAQQLAQLHRDAFFGNVLHGAFEQVRRPRRFFFTFL